MNWDMIITVGIVLAAALWLGWRFVHSGGGCGCSSGGGSSCGRGGGSSCGCGAMPGGASSGCGCGGKGGCHK